MSPDSNSPGEDGLCFVRASISVSPSRHWYPRIRMTSSTSTAFVCWIDSQVAASGRAIASATGWRFGAMRTSSPRHVLLAYVQAAVLLLQREPVALRVCGRARRQRRRHHDGEVALVSASPSARLRLIFSVLSESRQGTGASTSPLRDVASGGVGRVQEAVPLGREIVPQAEHPQGGRWRRFWAKYARSWPTGLPLELVVALARRVLDVAG